MPVYEYVCRDCRRRVRIEQSVEEHERRRPRCPRCGGRKLERIWAGISVHTSRKS